MLMPAWAARGWLVATMPLVLITTERRDGKEYFKSIIPLTKLNG